MKNVAEIIDIAESGDLTGAHNALDSLLEMGPRNIDALKLRARLFAVSGRFQQEARVWEQVANIDQNDLEFQEYLQRRQSEDRENFYFTDTLPGGGKRFIAFPRRMIKTATFGLVGCLTFLGMARLSTAFPMLNHPLIMISTFAALVIGPWVAIIVSYLRTIRYVSVTKDGFTVATRFKLHHLSWKNIEQVYLAQDDRHDTYKLTLLVKGKENESLSFEMDFNENTTSIRARSYLIREIMHSWGEPQYVARKHIELGQRPLLRI